MPNSDNFRGGPVLAITTGPNGYRLALIGGARFEVLADRLTWDEATARLREARALSAAPFTSAQSQEA
jgi:hypothetical protein